LDNSFLVTGARFDLEASESLRAVCFDDADQVRPPLVDPDGAGRLESLAEA